MPSNLRPVPALPTRQHSRTHSNSQLTHISHCAVLLLKSRTRQIPSPKMCINNNTTTTRNTIFPQSSSFLGGGPQGWSIRCKNRGVNQSLSAQDEQSPTSVISNLTRPIASPSAIARKDASVGWPTIDDSVSRCWCASHSLCHPFAQPLFPFSRMGCTYYLDKSAWPECNPLSMAHSTTMGKQRLTSASVPSVHCSCSFSQRPINRTKKINTHNALVVY